MGGCVVRCGGVDVDDSIEKGVWKFINVTRF